MNPINSLEVRRTLADALQIAPIGPIVASGDHTEILSQSHSWGYLMSFLVPTAADPGQRFDPTSNDELDQSAALRDVQAVVCHCDALPAEPSEGLSGLFYCRKIPGEDCNFAGYRTGSRTGGWLIVDGSFVMGCVDEPDEIDAVLVLAADWDLSAELNPYQYNLVSKQNVRRRFPIEVFTAIADSATEKKWIEYFLQVNIKRYEAHGFATSSQNGLARISL
jgi:hypothetical protein